MWKLLTLKKSSVDHISVRSAKIFILGICGIDSQMVFEASEADSTPSTSAGESKSNDDFFFTSPEQLSAIRSKFYEMVLHKLTNVKDSKSKSLKENKEYKIESNQNFTDNLIEQNMIRNKSPINDANKEIETEEDNKNESSPVVMFKRARFVFPDTSQEFDRDITSSQNEINLQMSNHILPTLLQFDSNNLGFCDKNFYIDAPSINEDHLDDIKPPILHLNVHIGGGIKKELNIYSINTFYKEAEDFCKLHNVPAEKQDLLITIVKRNKIYFILIKYFLFISSKQIWSLFSCSILS